MSARLVPALQFDDEEAAQKVLEDVTALGIEASVLPLEDLSPEDMTDWIDPGSGEWILLIDEEHLDEAMESLWGEDLALYSQEEEEEGEEEGYSGDGDWED